MSLQLLESTYKNANIIVGSDRQSEFENLVQKYNGDLYNFDRFRNISAWCKRCRCQRWRMSASKMRKAVVDGDDVFRRGTPKDLMM